MDKSKKILEDLVENYRHATTVSQGQWLRAQQVLPGGDTRYSTFFQPYAAAIISGKGARVVDADGNELIDCLNNYSALVLGHRHPDVMRAVEAQLREGTAFAAPHPRQAELAEVLVNRLPAADQVRFCNSGTEATMWSVRLARKFTGRDLVVKTFGGYHGAYQELSQWTGGDHVVRYGDLSQLASLVRRIGNQVAGIILEPVLGNAGVIAPPDGYLQGVRELCDEAGALMILDEVMTFRLSPGGAQTLNDVRPDLTTLGKIIGGGFPVGAFAGKRSVMQLVDPTRSNTIPHSGTYNGNPVTMAAGVATLDALTNKSYQRLDALGGSVAAGLREAIARRTLPMSITRAGSLLQVHASTEPKPPLPGEKRDDIALRALHLALYLHGVYCAPRGYLNMSLALDDHDCAEIIRAFRAALDDIAPLVHEHAAYGASQTARSHPA